MFFWLDVEAAKRRSEEWIRKAEVDRLLREAKQVRSDRGKRLVPQAIQWLAGNLIRWGCLLQEHYSDSAPKAA